MVTFVPPPPDKKRGYRSAWRQQTQHTTSQEKKGQISPWWQTPKSVPGAGPSQLEEEEELMDPTSSHSATNNGEVRETNWTFNPTLAQEALCCSRREERKIHSSAAGSSNKPFAVTRYTPCAQHLPTDNFHPEGCSLGPALGLGGWRNRRREELYES